MDERQLAPGLYLVATPIGNLEDITLRALRVLRSVDRIACEDTRQTQKLLNHYGIQTPTVSYHLYNESSRAEELVDDLKRGGRVAVVSDAGTPCIADPGAMLVQAAIRAGVQVFPIPGANAALSALAGSGLNAESFVFLGFLPSKQGPRRSLLEGLVRRGGPVTLSDAVKPADLVRTDGKAACELATQSFAGESTIVFYETPHRILETLLDLEQALGPGRRIVVARELTKLHEEFVRGSVSQVRQEFSGRPSIRGEMVLLIESGEAAADPSPASRQTISQQVAILMRESKIGEMDALKRVARERGMGKSEAYREFQRERKKV